MRFHRFHPFSYELHARKRLTYSRPTFDEFRGSQNSNFKIQLFRGSQKPEVTFIGRRVSRFSLGSL